MRLFVLLLLFISAGFVACSSNNGSSENTDGDADSDSDGDGDSDSDSDADSDADSDPSYDGPTRWLHTEGNKIYYDDDVVFRGRGANIHDTRSCNACTWSEPNVDEVTRRIDALTDDWGANFLRLLLESYPAADGRTHWQSPVEDEAYLQDIVEIVEHIGTKPNTYVLVSLWAEPTTTDLCWPTEETNSVWRTITAALAQYPHVMFGIVNEPEANWSGEDDANVWQAMNAAVAAIREAENELGSPQHLVAVQGTRRWARDLEYYVENPITAGDGTNIVYETHSYVPADEFEGVWLNAAQTIPVLIGEFGPSEYMDNDDIIAMMDAAEQNDVPWAAWTFHMRCAPSLLVDNSAGGCGEDMDIAPTDWGQLIKDRLATPWLTK